MGAFVNLGSFIIQFVNICVIIFVLNRFLFKPYLAYLKIEEKKRSNLELAHDELELTKKEAKKDARMIIDDAKKDAEGIKANAEVLAKKEASNIVGEAKNEGERIKRKASLDVDNERKALYAELKYKVLDVALNMNEKLFGKNEANKEFITKALKEEKITK